ncbi:MAG TPA: metallophosphoesterase [Alphaproteobacteria bacterium]|nr:metallophosphoesterase [Alphaproteobacteria bacterium]
MKVLFFVDTHGLRSLDRIGEKAKDADLLVCCGDITNFEMELHEVLNKLNSFNKPLILIHGNHESESLGQDCQKFSNIHFIHNSYYIYNDLIFYGYGGGGFSQRDSNFRRNADIFMQEFPNICKKDGKSYRLILLTHAPPFETKVDNKYGQHVGNKDIKEFIINYKPMLAVSGHIHETAGADETINGTRMFNPGSNGMMINL